MRGMLRITRARAPGPTLHPVSAVVRILWFALLVVAVCGQTDPGTDGFISIDCGARSGYNNTQTQIPWSADALTVGRTYTVNVPNVAKELLTLRAFPPGGSPVRTCYSIAVLPGTAYLVRAGFMYANYDKQSRPPQFGLYLDATLWQHVDLTATGPIVYYEAITSSAREYSLGNITVCLRRMDPDNPPIINSLELRPLPNNTYADRLRMSPGSVDVNLYLVSRINFGGPFIRFPQDRYDRFWQGYTMLPEVRGLPVLNAPGDQTFTWQTPTDAPPDIVLQTAISAPNISFTISSLPNTPFQAYGSQFSCQLNTAPGEVDMDWSIYTMLHGAYTPYMPSYNSALTLSSPFSCAQYGVLNGSISSNFSLRLGSNSPSGGNPVLGAQEIYSIVPVTLGTSTVDVLALADLKNRLGITFGSWVGDPCLPNAWDRVKCSSDSPPRVTYLDLSRIKASGPVPQSVGNLTALEYLSLANNSFTGPIPDLSALTLLSFLSLATNRLSGKFPDWLGLLPYLKTLHIENNQISGPFPHNLAVNLGPNFSYNGNTKLCDDSTPSCISENAEAPSAISPFPGQEKSSKTDFILGVGAGILITILVMNALFVIYCICRCRTPKYHKPSENGWPAIVSALPHDGDIVHQLYPPERRLRAQCYPYSTIKSATNNFGERLGEGGFGPVYYGVLSDNQQVAVKVVPVKSNRETHDILDELDVLSVGLHKNVVPLVGYSQNMNEILFMYAFMAEGDLQSRLYGSKAASDPLTWKERLKVAVDAAEGLEFLHHTCRPSIVHGNVKSTNVFLSKSLEGKMGHYGVAKLMEEQGGNIANVVNKTRGYLDPEYYATRRLSVKSDVYSFGVLVLEILCGRSPLLDPRAPASAKCTSIVDWVRASLQKGTVEGIMDPRLRGHYNLATAWNVAEIAIHCVEMNSKCRPTMTEVVLDLTRAVEMDSTSDEKSAPTPAQTNGFVYHSPHNLPSV